MTPHDLKTLSECAVILRQTKNKIAKKARYCKDVGIIGEIGAAVAVIENHACKLENHYSVMKRKIDEAA